MKIGQQQIGATHRSTWSNEDRGFSREGNDLSIGLNRRLKQTERRGADSKDPPAMNPRTIDRSSGAGADFTPLGVHPMRRDVVHPYGQERPSAHMQRHGNQSDTPLANAPKQVWREVKAGCRRRDGTLMRGKDCLVVATILLAVAFGPIDVGGQCERAGDPKRIPKGASLKVKAEHHRTVFVAPDNLCLEHRTAIKRQIIPIP